MSLIRPFCALRPTPNNASKVAAVPYDVVNQVEARELARGNTLSFLHVSRSEIDLDTGTNPYSDEVYKRASSNLENLIRDCPFLTEEKPSLYLYRLQMGQHEQTGIVGTFSIDEYDSNQVKKHERTRRDKEDDRTRHITQLSAQTGPVFLTYSSVSEIDREVDRWKASLPVYDFVAADGIVHTLWVISEPGNLVQHFANRIGALYIADGHHRAAAASRVRAELASRNPKHQGKEDYNYFLAVAFPEAQLRILPYHRVVKDLAEMNDIQFLEKVKSLFDVTSWDSSLPASGKVGMYLRGKWYLLSLRDQQQKFKLDVELLQEVLLEPVLGIGDPRTDKRIDFVGGIRGTSELEKLVNIGEAAVAFSLHPTQLKDVMEISDQGGIMPPKSTWFEPKLRDGLFVHRIGQAY